MAPLVNSSSSYFSIMEWWTIAALMLNHLKLQNNRGWHLSWRWWLLTILGTKLLVVKLLHWSKNFGSVPSCTMDGADGDKDGDGNTSVTVFPMAPLVLRVSGTEKCTLMTFSPSIQVRLLCQRGTTRHQQRLLLFIKHELSLWFDPHTLWPSYPS